MNILRQFKNRGKIRNRGSGNTILFLKDNKPAGVKCLCGLTIDIKGQNNVVKIHLPQQLEKTKLIIRGNNNKFELGDSKWFTRNTTYFMDHQSDSRAVSIGRDLLCAGADFIIALNESRFVIGNNCMFSYQIQVRNHDGHTILDKQTREPLHKKEPMIIGDNVWIGFRSIIVKNVTLSEGTIVGAGSIVTKSHKEPYCAIAGNPAKIVRQGVTWVHENLDSYLKQV